MENRLNHSRLIATLEEMGRLGIGPGGKRNRLALTDADKAARDLLCTWIKEAGLELKIDAMGNIFGVLKGTESGDPIFAGSHIDTVPDAGMYDGCVGVLSGLEALRTIAEKRIPHRRSLAVAALTNEEGARFLPGLMGSEFIEGRLSAEEAKASRDRNGISVGEELERIGYAGFDSVKPGAYLEFHIEQGPFLDAKGFEIGVVTGVTGIRRWDVRIKGEANHAGTTPMTLRHDPLLALSHLHCELSQKAEAASAVFTIGHLEVFPGAINVIPGEVFFTIDLRSQDKGVLDALAAECASRLRTICAERGLTLEMKPTETVEPVKFDPKMVDKVEHFANARGLSNLRMGSGAGHDAEIFALRVPTAMIFVPSIGGKSHCPDEFSKAEHICHGAEILTDCLLALAN